MKKVYSVEFTDTLVAIGIILGFFAIMAIMALFIGM